MLTLLWISQEFSPQTVTWLQLHVELMDYIVFFHNFPQVLHQYIEA